mmetsp:Transcript_36508/g.95330  ORF Transcript_36508/g.95330 Transcript_36508/m.95330 type:complete len:224 (-) Transcript_36508:782-1453(-)
MRLPPHERNGSVQPSRPPPWHSAQPCPGASSSARGSSHGRHSSHSGPSGRKLAPGSGGEPPLVASAEEPEAGAWRPRNEDGLGLPNSSTGRPSALSHGTGAASRLAGALHSVAPPGAPQAPSESAALRPCSEGASGRRWPPHMLQPAPPQARHSCGASTAPTSGREGRRAPQMPQPAPPQARHLAGSSASGMASYLCEHLFASQRPQPAPPQERQPCRPTSSS